MVIFADAKELLDLGDEAEVGVVDLLGVQLLHLLLRDEPALVAESLLRQILPTVVPHLLLGAADVLLLPVLLNFEQHQSVLEFRTGKGGLWAEAALV